MLRFDTYLGTFNVNFKVRYTYFRFEVNGKIRRQGGVKICILTA